MVLARVSCLFLLYIVASAVSSRLDFNHVVSDPDPAMHRHFGHSICFAPAGMPLLVVGSPSLGSGTGAVFLFRFNTSTKAWTLLQTITGPASFGTSLALVGSAPTQTLAVGIPGADQVMLFHSNMTTRSLFEHFKTLQGEANTAFGEKVAFSNHWLFVAEPKAAYQVGVGGHHTLEGRVTLFRRPAWNVSERVQMPYHENDPTVHLGVGTSNFDVYQRSEGTAVVSFGVPGRSQGRGGIVSIQTQMGSLHVLYRIGVAEGRPVYGSPLGFGAHVGDRLAGFRSSNHTLIHGRMIPGRHAARLHDDVFFTCHADRIDVYRVDADAQRFIPLASVHAPSGQPKPSVQFGFSVAAMRGENALAVGDPGSGRVFLSVPEVATTWPPQHDVEIPVFASVLTGDDNPGRLTLSCPRCFAVKRSYTLTAAGVGPTHPRSPSPHLTHYIHDAYVSIPNSLPQNVTYTLHYTAPFEDQPAVPRSLVLKPAAHALVERLRIGDAYGVVLTYGQQNVTWAKPSAGVPARPLRVCLAAEKHIFEETCVNASSAQGSALVPTNVDLDVFPLGSALEAVVVDPSAPENRFRATYSEDCAHLDAPVKSLDPQCHGYDLTVGGFLKIKLAYRTNYPLPAERRFARVTLEHLPSRYVKVLHEKLPVPGTLIVNQTQADWPSLKLQHQYVRIALWGHERDYFKMLEVDYCKPEGKGVQLNYDLPKKHLETVWNQKCHKPTYANLELVQVDNNASRTLLHGVPTNKHTVALKKLLIPGKQYVFRWSCASHPEFRAQSRTFGVDDPMAKWWPVIFIGIGGAVVVVALVLVGVLLVRWKRRKDAVLREDQTALL